MTRLEQLAALAARVVPVRTAAAPQGPHAPGPGEVGYIVSDQDGADLAEAYNAIPALAAIAKVSARINDRAKNGRTTLLVADRKALAAAFEALGT